MKSNQKGFSLVEISIVIVVLGFIGGAYWFMSSGVVGGKGPLTTVELKRKDSKDEKSKSKASENAWRNELDSIKLSDYGLTKEGDEYIDYCEQHDESGKFLNHEYVKVCNQRLLLYLSSSEDIKTVNSRLTNIFQQTNRSIVTDPQVGVCLSGQANLLSNSDNTTSKSGDLTIANHFSSQFVIRPVHKDQLDTSYACIEKIKDIYFTQNETAYINKSTTLDENKLQITLTAKQANSIVILAFHKTYYSEKI